MYNSVECPYCNHENDMTDALSEGLSNDNTTDWECSNCEEEFEVHVEFIPSFSAAKIEYEECGVCKNETRDFHTKGKTFPYPKHIKEDNLCHSCYLKGMDEEYNQKTSDEPNEEIPKWLSEQVELHENTVNDECGCNSDEMSLCYAGQYVNGLLDASELDELRKEAELERKNINGWKENEFGNFFSHHILETHLGDQEPKYHVLKNPDGDGWVIGVFYSFVGGEYVPLEEEGEERLTFNSAIEAMNYVDSKLENL